MAKRKRKKLVLHVREDAGELLTLGDLATLEKFGNEAEDMSIADIIAILEKVLEEDPNTIPIAQMEDAVSMIEKALKQTYSDEAAKN